MVGFECNEQRFAYSLTLQSRLFDPFIGGKYNKIATMSQFFEGDGINFLIKLLGSTDSIVHLRLLYWFREGWDPNDVLAVLDFFNRLVINLEWIICDMKREMLLDFGFKGHIISSVHFSGPMSKSSNSRTLYVHHVQMQSTSTRTTRKTIHTVGEREKLIVENFRSSSSEAHSRVTDALELIRIRSDESKKDRAAALKRKRSTKLTPPESKPPKIKIQKLRQAPRLRDEDQRIPSNNVKKAHRAPSLERNRSIVLTPQPKSPTINISKPKSLTIKISKPRSSPRIKALVIKEKSTKQEAKREAKLEAKRLKEERNYLEVLDFIKNYNETFEFSP
jgi:hypothetical protein